MITAIEVDSLNRVRVKDEAGLIAGTRAGDTSCFEALMSRYERRIYRLARTVVKNESDAEEIAQEAFFKAFEHIEGFKGDSRFYTWLARITVNEALMKLRKRKPERISLDDPIAKEVGSVPLELEDWSPNPEKIYSQNELAQILCDAISELHPRLRIVFQLRDVESLSTEETSNLLGISISAVKSRLLRARLGLREKLNPFMGKNTGSAAVLPYVFADRAMPQARPERVSVQ
jgi:RNA polymerase sigma-70 factor, ECF subfamily